MSDNRERTFALCRSAAKIRDSLRPPDSGLAARRFATQVWYAALDERRKLSGRFRDVRRSRRKGGLRRLAPREHPFSKPPSARSRTGASSFWGPRPTVATDKGDPT